MFVMKKGLVTAFIVFFTCFYNGCFDDVGPNRIIDTTEYRTSKADGIVHRRKEHKQVAIPLSVPGLMFRNIELNGDNTAMTYKSNGKWTDISYMFYEEMGRTVAKAFISLGLKEHEAVGIIGFNSPEWFYTNLGAIYAGGLSAGIYVSNDAETYCQCLLLSNAKIVVVEDKKQVDKILLVKDRLEGLIKIIQYKDTPNEDDVMSWNDLLILGLSQSDDALDERLGKMAINECCTLVFTSETEATPKAIMLSHDNLVFNASTIESNMPMETGKEVIFSYLPLSRIANQIIDIYVAMSIGARVYFADKDASKNDLINTLKYVKPTIFKGIPRVWNQFKNELVKQGLDFNFVRKYFTKMARRVGLEHYQQSANGNEDESIKFKAFKKTIYGPMKSYIGLDKIKHLITKAKTMTSELKQYFLSIDIPIIEIFGMPECTGAHSLGSIIDDNGGVGRTFEEATSEIDHPGNGGFGELCIVGNHVFMGYLGQQKKTEAAIDSKGWFHTGYFARIHSDGYIYTIGRMDGLITLNSGEKVPPVYIARNIRVQLPVISNAYIVGNNRPYLTALLTLKCQTDSVTKEPLDDLASEVISWLKRLDCKHTKVSDIIYNIPANVENAILTGIFLANKKAILNTHHIKKFMFIPDDFSIPTGELGPTQIINSDVVEDKYKYFIEELYRYEL